MWGVEVKVGVGKQVATTYVLAETKQKCGHKVLSPPNGLPVEDGVRILSI